MNSGVLSDAFVNQTTLVLDDDDALVVTEMYKTHVQSFKWLYCNQNQLYGSNTNHLVVEH